jgi:hypothetical protein
MAVINYFRVEKFAEVIALTVMKSNRGSDRLLNLLYNHGIAYDSGEKSVKEIVAELIVKRMEATYLDHNEVFAEVILGLMGE